MQRLQKESLITPYLPKLLLAILLTVSSPTSAKECMYAQQMGGWSFGNGRAENTIYYLLASNVVIDADSASGSLDATYTVNGSRTRLCRGDTPCTFDRELTKLWKGMPNDGSRGESVLVYSADFTDSTGKQGWTIAAAIKQGPFIVLDVTTGSGEKSLATGLIGTRFSLTCDLSPAQ